jgi:YgiT-type zinc finger domain-containing protein
MLQVRYITYFTWLGGELITVPNFPAWVCDVCGRREYDERAISWLTMLLSPNAGRPTPKTSRHVPARRKPDTSHPRPE